METSMKQIIRNGIVTSALLFAASPPATAQQAVQRTQLGDTNFPPGYHTVTSIVTVPANGCIPRHTHPGLEFVTVLTGEVTFEVGDNKQLVTSGKTFEIAPGIAHGVC